MIIYIMNSFIDCSLLSSCIPCWPSDAPQVPGPGEVSFQDKMTELRQTFTANSVFRDTRPTVVISGAGPAGLIRGIQSLLNGNPTTIIERRSRENPGRDNIVALQPNAVAILQNFGIYQYLLEHGLVYPYAPERRSVGNVAFNVRLGDLEDAMKTVISALTSDPIIQYDSKVLELISLSMSPSMLLVQTGAEEEKILSVDILVVAEGKNSSTNEMLGIERSVMLPPVPAITAIFKDDRPSVDGVFSLLTYIGKTALYIAIDIYYHVLLLFKCIFEGEHVFNANRSIAGSVLLQIPAYTYLGGGLSREKSEELMRLVNAVKESKRALNEAEASGAFEQISALTQAVRDAEIQKEAFLTYWIHLSFCLANFLNLGAFLYSLGATNLSLSSWKPIDSMDVVEIGADYASHACQRFGASIVLLAGDSLVTADPSTGLGCTSAIESSSDFQTLLESVIERGTTSASPVLTRYRESAVGLMRRIQGVSIGTRRVYRPDAVAVVRS
jgi:hypothetical protein